jgi:hypothetical protein
MKFFALGLIASSVFLNAVRALPGTKGHLSLSALQFELDEKIKELEAIKAVNTACQAVIQRQFTQLAVCYKSLGDAQSGSQSVRVVNTELVPTVTTTIWPSTTPETDTLTTTRTDTLTVTRTDPFTVTETNSLTTTETDTVMITMSIPFPMSPTATVENTITVSTTVSGPQLQASECADALAVQKRLFQDQTDELRRVEARLGSCENTQKRLTVQLSEANIDLELCKHDVWVHIHDGHA